MTTHEFIKTGTDNSGAEIWECPLCTRTILLTFPPRYSKQVLVEGDAGAQHIGSKGLMGGEGSLVINATVATVETRDEPL